MPALVDDKELGTDRGRRAMRRVAVIRDLIAHPGLEPKSAAVAQFAIEFTFKHVQHVPAVAPMVGMIAGRIFDMTDLRSPILKVRQIACPVSPG